MRSISSKPSASRTLKVTSLKLRGVFQSIVTVLIAAALTGCGGGGGGGSSSNAFLPPSPPIHTLAEAQARAQWTVLVYLDADNDLESAGIHNFNQMEMIGSTRDVHVIVQMDRMTGTEPDNDSWTDTHRYLIIQDSDPNRMHSIRLDDPALGELDMADPLTLRSFVQWGMSEFPADNYLLIIWDHGTGWQIRSTSLPPQYKYIADDDTSGNVMNITSIPLALAGLNLDVIAFDACYMQELEIAHELRGSARYMVGSAAVEPSPGYNYARLLSHIAGGTTPEQMCGIIVNQYAAEYPNPRSNITQSAVDLQKIGDVANAANELALVLEANAVTHSASLAAARETSLDYSSVGAGRHSLDLLDYASKSAGAVGPNANVALTDLQNAMSAAVIASTHNSDMPNAHGLGIYVPRPASYDSRYEQLSLAFDTNWDEWLLAQRQ